jgi:hypothetical protein
MIIVCPKCDYYLTPNILWICPGSHKFWHDTCCPRCRLWSPHDDWYRDDAPNRQLDIKRKLPQQDRELSTNLKPDVPLADLVKVFHTGFEMGQKNPRSPEQLASFSVRRLRTDCVTIKLFDRLSASPVGPGAGMHRGKLARPKAEPADSSVLRFL